MCSNTSRSSSCGDGSGCSGNGYNNMLSSASKNNKEKRPRVPKRGPGVAELEKILREQEKDKLEGFSSTCLVSNSEPLNMSTPFGSLQMKSPPPPSPLPPLQLTPASVLSTTSLPIPTDFPPSSCLPPHVPLAPNFDHLTPVNSPAAMSRIYANGGHNSSKGGGISGCGVSAIGGSALAFSEQAFFTATESSTKLNDKRFPLVTTNESNRPWPSTPSPQKRNYQYPSPAINPFLVSGSSSSSTSSAARLYSHLEPPSNQNVYNNYSTVLSEEQKTIGTKRPYPFSSIQYSLDSPQFQFPPMSSFINRQEQTSSYDLDHSTTFLTRNVKWDIPLELHSRKCNNIPSSFGVCEHRNFSTSGTSTISLQATRPFEGALTSKCKAVPYQARLQEKMEENSNENVESVGPCHQPYYSFLQEKDLKGMHERSHGLNSSRCESDSDSIDLSLKL